VDKTMLLGEEGQRISKGIDPALPAIKVRRSA
jgi:hypothetical protein